jgi:amino acid transporter
MPVLAMIPTPGTVISDSDKPRPTAVPKTPSALDTALTSIWNSITAPLYFVLSLIAITVLIWTGYRYISSAGDPGKMKEAQANLVQAILGITLVFSTTLVLSLVIGFAQSVVGTISGTGAISPPTIRP